MTTYVIASLVLIVYVQLASTQISMPLGGIAGPMPRPMPGPIAGPMAGRANMPPPMPFATLRSVSKDFTFPGPQIFPGKPHAKENSIYPDLASILLLHKGMGAFEEPRRSRMQQQSSFLPLMMAGNMIEEELLPFFLMSRGM